MPKVEDMNDNDVQVTEEGLTAKQKLANFKKKKSEGNSTKPKSKPKASTADVKEPNVFEIQNIPSRGVLYDRKLYGRPLKVIEVKKLAAMNEVNSNFIINDIIKRTIQGVDLNTLLMGDKTYLIFWLRANTYREPGFKIPFQCMDLECKQEGDFHFTVDNLEIQYLPDDFSNDKLSFTTLNDDKIKFHLLRVAEEDIAKKFKTTYKDIIKDIDNVQLDIAIAIDTINGDELDLLSKYTYLEKDIKPSTYAHIKSYIEHYDCGLQQFMTVKCEKCGGESLIAATFHEEFFLPKYKID